MSQMGNSIVTDNDTIYYDPPLGDYINPYDPSSPFNDKFNIQRATILLIFSTIGLLGNFLTILLVIAVQKLQQPHNSFFLHHCILDTVKSAYCIVFSKVSVRCLSSFKFLLVANVKSSWHLKLTKPKISKQAILKALRLLKISENSDPIKSMYFF